MVEEPAPYTGTPPPQDTAWHSGLDADLKGHVANRGWDKLDATSALQQAVKAHREAERLIGVPAEQVLRLPKDINDTEGYGRIYKALGAPADAKEYDFSGVKFADNSELNPEFAEGLRGLAAKLHLPKDGAVEVAKWVASTIDADEAKETAEYTAKLTAEKETLAKNWGANAGVNKIIAQNAATKLGVDAEAMAALEKSIGYAKVMDMFRNIGSKIGEDKFVNNGNGSGSDVMTADQAQAKLDMLARDEGWMTKFNAGDITAKTEFDNLTKLITAARMQK